MYFGTNSDTAVPIKRIKKEGKKTESHLHLKNLSALLVVDRSFTPVYQQNRRLTTNKVICSQLLVDVPLLRKICLFVLDNQSRTFCSVFRHCGYYWLVGARNRYHIRNQHSFTYRRACLLFQRIFIDIVILEGPTGMNSEGTRCRAVQTSVSEENKGATSGKQVLAEYVDKQGHYDDNLCNVFRSGTNS